MFIMYRNHHYTRNLSTTEYMKHRRSITGCVEHTMTTRLLVWLFFFVLWLKFADAQLNLPGTIYVR